MDVREVFEASKNILSGITFKLFAVALLYVDDILDDDISHLVPEKAVSKWEIRDFFQMCLKQLI